MAWSLSQSDPSMVKPSFSSSASRLSAFLNHRLGRQQIRLRIVGDRDQNREIAMRSGPFVVLRFGLKQIAKRVKPLRRLLRFEIAPRRMQLDDAEQNAIKWGRKMVAKLESRVKELEQEMDSEQRRLGDATKNLRKAERGIKEYTFRYEEDHKNSERMQELIDKLQNQVRKKKYIFCPNFKFLMDSSIYVCELLLGPFLQEAN